MSDRFGQAGGQGVDHVSYGRFLDEFAGAVHAAEGLLSSDIIYCGRGGTHRWDPHFDYMGMRCSDYAAVRKMVFLPSILPTCCQDRPRTLRQNRKKSDRFA